MRTVRYQPTPAQHEAAAKRLSAALIALVLLAAVACGDHSPASVQLLDLAGETVDPLQVLGAKASVFLFTSVDCPISNRYAPEVRRLHQEFASRGVAFWLVYPNPAESAEAIEQHLGEYGYALEALRDPEHQLVRLTEASVTPEAAVFIPGGEMVYRGRIDNRYVDFGKARPAPTRHDLEEVLQAVLEDGPITAATTTAIGCYISDMKP